MKTMRKPELQYRAGISFSPLSVDQIEYVYQCVGHRAEFAGNSLEAWPSLVDECAEQFIHDHYEQGNQATGAMLIRLQRVSSAATRLLGALGVQADQAELQQTDLSHSIENAKSEANARSNGLVASGGEVEGGWPDLESDVRLLIALRNSVDQAHGQSTGLLTRRLHAFAAGTRRLLRALGVRDDNPQSVPSDLSRQLHFARPWTHSSRLTPSGGKDSGSRSDLGPEVSSLIALRDASDQAIKRLRLRSPAESLTTPGDALTGVLEAPLMIPHSEPAATPRAHFIESLICCYIVAYGHEPRVNEGKAVGGCWDFTAAVVAATRSNLSDVVRRTDPTIERALFVTPVALADILKSTIKRLRDLADSEATHHQAPRLLGLALFVIEGVRRDK